MALFVLITLISLASSSTNMDSFGPFCWSGTCYTSTSACSSIGGSNNNLDNWCFVEPDQYSLLGPFCYKFGGDSQCWTSTTSLACNRIGGSAIGPWCLAPIGSKTYEAFGPFCWGYGSSYTCYYSDTLNVCEKLGGIYIGGSTGVWCILDSNQYKALGAFCVYNTWGYACYDSIAKLACNKLDGSYIGNGKWCIIPVSDDFPGFGTSTTAQSDDRNSSTSATDQSEVELVTWKDIAIGLICLCALQLAGCMIAGGYYYCGKRGNKDRKDEKEEPLLQSDQVNEDSEILRHLQSDEVNKDVKAQDILQSDNTDGNAQRILQTDHVNEDGKTDQVIRMRFNQK